MPADLESYVGGKEDGGDRKKKLFQRSALVVRRSYCVFKCK